ncbi:unnamed protein product [Spodoptera exigua]|nr:unnamed protein product [Spodoptera exigua]
MDDIFMDVDRFLSVDDFIEMFENGQIWPWGETHFIKRELCPGCYYPVPDYLPEHFIIDFSINNNILAVTSEENFFFCVNCPMAVYDHFPPDECEACASNE